MLDIYCRMKNAEWSFHKSCFHVPSLIPHFRTTSGNIPAVMQGICKMSSKPSKLKTNWHFSWLKEAIRSSRNMYLEWCFLILSWTVSNTMSRFVDNTILLHYGINYCGLRKFHKNLNNHYNNTVKYSSCDNIIYILWFVFDCSLVTLLSLHHYLLLLMLTITFYTERSNWVSLLKYPTVGY